MGIHQPYDQFVSDDDTLDRVARVQFCLLETGNYSIVSRCATKEAERPVEILSLSRLPYRLEGDENYQDLSPAQARRHSSILRKIARQDLPKEKRFLRNWAWGQTGLLRTVNSFTVRVPSQKNNHLPARMAGDHVVKSAVFAIEAPNHDLKEAYLAITGLPADFLKFFPKNNIIYAYLLGHEFTHIFQKTFGTAVPQEGPIRFAMEDDADGVSIGALFKLAKNDLVHRVNEIKEFAQVLKYARAVSGYISQMPHYWIAMPNVGHDAAVLSMYELRYRVYAYINKIEIPESSAELQAQIKHWLPRPRPNDEVSRGLSQAFGGPFKWKDVPLEDSFVALQQIIKSGKIDDPLTLRNAKLVFDGLNYFHHGIEAKADLQLVSDVQPTYNASSQPEPAARQPTGSSALALGKNVYAAPSVT